ncbi:MAG: hypothetical protein GX442_06140 [Candidatus Riflebacteria bacterium]|nr:hypothetical protein [Candidatus Riflebacteria bacterium]
MTEPSSWSLFRFAPGLASGPIDARRLGGKGAGLAVMTAAGLPVPPGFILPVDCCRAWNEAGHRLPPELADEVRKAVGWLETVTGRRFGAGAAPLLVSVRSGAPVSMPGMMDTLLDVGLSHTPPAGHPDPEAWWDSFRGFARRFADIVWHLPTPALDEAAAPPPGPDDGSPAAQARALIERLSALAGRPFPTDPWDCLWQAIDAVFASWDSERARTYRARHALHGLAGTAVTVQVMFPSDVAGVLFTVDPSTFTDRVVIEAAPGLGEALVQGSVDPDRFVVDRPTRRILERHLRSHRPEVGNPPSHEGHPPHANPVARPPDESPSPPATGATGCLAGAKAATDRPPPPASERFPAGATRPAASSPPDHPAAPFPPPDRHDVGRASPLPPRMAAQNASFAHRQGADRHDAGRASPLPPRMAARNAGFAHRQGALLTDDQVLELTELGLRVEAHFGHPVDIEWGLAADGGPDPVSPAAEPRPRFALLQSRPVKGLAVARDLPAARADLRQELRGRLGGRTGAVWAIHNLAETLPAPRPLTWDIIGAFLAGEEGFLGLYRDLGFTPSARVCRQGFLELIAGRPYADLERAAELFYDDFPLEYDLDPAPGEATARSALGSAPPSVPVDPPARLFTAPAPPLPPEPPARATTAPGSPPASDTPPPLPTPTESRVPSFPTPASVTSRSTRAAPPSPGPESGIAPTLAVATPPAAPPPPDLLARLAGQPTRFNLERAGGGFLLRLPYYLFLMFRSHRRFRQVAATWRQTWDTEVLPRFLAEVERCRALDLRALGDDDLLAELDRRERLLHWIGKESLKPGFLAGHFHARLVDDLRLVFGPAEGDRRAATLVQGLPGDRTVEANIALFRVAAGEIGLDAFLAEFGHRAAGEFELAEPRWWEEPAFPLQVIARYRQGGSPTGRRSQELPPFSDGGRHEAIVPGNASGPTDTRSEVGGGRQDGESSASPTGTTSEGPPGRHGGRCEASVRRLARGPSPADLHRRQEAARKAAEAALAADLAAAGASALEPGIRANLAGAQACLPFRETGKDFFMRAVDLVRRVLQELARRWDLGGDLYFLRREELAGFPARRADLLPALAARRTRWQAWQKLDLPEVIRAQDLDTLGDPRPVAPVAGDLAGVPVAPGVATGTVRILRSPAEAGDLGPHPIIVCPSTDPGWTPLFVQACGLVVERGGTLSHGALIAREFGIPAVVLPDATRILREGEELRLDGSTGSIERLDGSAGRLESLGGSAGPFENLGGSAGPLESLGGAAGRLERLDGSAGPLESLGGAAAPPERLDGGGR